MDTNKYLGFQISIELYMIDVISKF